MKIILEFQSLLRDHGEFEPELRCFTNTGAWSFENFFTVHFCEGEWVFPMVVNLVHDCMFPMVGVMLLHD